MFPAIDRREQLLAGSGGCKLMAATKRNKKKQSTKWTKYKNEILYLVSDPGEAARLLGLLSENRGGGTESVQVCCPFHNDTEPSLSIFVGYDNRVYFNCFGCGYHGDFFSVAAKLHGLDVRRQFRKVLIKAALIVGRLDLARAISGGRPFNDSMRQAPDLAKVMKKEPKKYLSSDDVLVFGYTCCQKVTSDSDAATYLQSRGLDPNKIADLNLARAIRDEVPPPKWAFINSRYWGMQGYRLATFLCDYKGIDRSVRARKISKDADAARKSVAPFGYSVRGLVFANETARRMINPNVRYGPLPEDKLLRVVIVEGEPDFLTWALQPDPPGVAVAVMGIVNGSWTKDIAARIPDNTTVVIRTDHDDAGDKYAARIINSLGDRCRLLRSIPSELDENDKLVAGVLPACAEDETVPVKGKIA